MSYKLDLINTALALTGNNHVNVEDDGSAEWLVASFAYEAGIRYLLGGHDWRFATAISELQRYGDSGDPDFEDAYHKPVNTLGVSWVRCNNERVEWKVIGNKIILTSQGGKVEAKVVLMPATEDIHPMFSAALESLVKAGCYEGLNEDASEARELRAEAEAKLSLARSRGDREGTPRQTYRSRILARRRGEVG